MSHRFAFTGFAQHGKDTAADYLVEHHGFTKLSLAQAVKDQLYIINPLIPHDGVNKRLSHLVDSYGWDETKKNPEVRSLLQRLGTEANRDFFDENIWVDYFKNTAFPPHQNSPVVVSDLRFPNELEALRELGFTVYRVTRPNFDNGVDITHGSERHIPHLTVDQDLLNDSTLDAFYAQIEGLL